MQLLRAATLTVKDIEATAARYAEWLDYRIVETGVVSRELAESWGCGDSAGQAFIVMRPASGSPVFLRFIQSELVPDYKPLRSHGWSTIELCVTDVMAVQERMARSPFEIIGPAKRNPSLTTIIPMQVRGPDDEIVYLTEILDDPPEEILPRARSPIDRVFILVMGCSDLEASRRWFEYNLGLTAGQNIAINYTMLAKSFGTPPDQKYMLCTMTHARDVLIELDQYPVQATPRPVNPGMLPPGIAIGTFLMPDIDRVAAEWIAPPVKRIGSIYGGARTGTVRAPDGTLVELIEVNPHTL